MSAVSRFARRLELDGIPTVGSSGVNVVKFKDYNVKYANGMPIRYVAFPFPVAGQPRSVHKEYVEGKDLLSGKPMMQAIIDALTEPLTDDEKKSGIPPEGAPEPRLLKADTGDNLRRLFKDREWTDFNSIILPTEKRVAEMLKGTSHAPDEIVCKSGSKEMTVEKAAVYAVMVGAEVKHFPAILAICTRASMFGNSTSSAANMIVVNGPIRKELGMNSGIDALGPFAEANSVLGRVFTIAGKIMGDLRLDEGAYSTLGSNLQYNNICFAENEEALPEGWEPLHVQMGFKPNDNVISVGIGWSYISSVIMAVQEHPVYMIMGDYMKSLTMGSATVIMDPTVAELLKDSYGFETKEQLSKWFAENVEKTQYPSGEKIKPFQESAIKIIVTGGGIQTTWFVTDFMMGPGMMGGSTLIDEWR